MSFNQEKTFCFLEKRPLFEYKPKPYVLIYLHIL